MAVGMIRCGRSFRDVARMLNVSHPTVRRWWMRWCDEGKVERKEGSGRPRKTSQTTDRKLIVAAKRNRFESTKRLAISWKFASNITCSIRTAYRRLSEAGMKSCSPAIRIPLSPEHKRKRLEWCEEHLNWTSEDWNRVMWTDESRFTLDFHDGRIRVHRMPGERYAECCISEHDRFGGGSVMVWAGIWHGGRTAVVVIKGTLDGKRYLSEILAPVVLPTVAENNLIFQDDNARPHRSHQVTTAVVRSGIEYLPWPSRSPDLSPIEHAWDELGRRVRDSYAHPPTNIESLATRLAEQWECIEQDRLNVLCASMNRRIRDCINARGGHTRY